MSELGHLLEVLHGAHEHTRTLQAEFRDWESPHQSSALVAELGEPPRLRWRDAGPWPRATESRRRLWLQHPTRLRVEVLSDGSLARVGVRSEAQWWRWDRQEGASSGGPVGAARAWIPPLLDPPLLTPMRLLGALRLKPAGVGERAGRLVLRAHATPRETVSARKTLSFELEFDAEHGTMVRIASFEEYRPLWLTEAVAVSYDQPIEPERFQVVALSQQIRIEVPVANPT